MNGYSVVSVNENMDEESSEGHLTLTRPYVDNHGAVKLADLLFGLRISDLSKVKEFVSYEDRNFYFKGVLPNQKNKQGNSTEDEFVLKILNHVDSENISYVNAQNALLLYLKEHGFVCPIPMRSLSDKLTMECELSSYGLSVSEENANIQKLPRRISAVRLLSYVPGKLLKDVRCTNDLLFNLGRYIAKMNKVLKVQNFFWLGCCCCCCFFFFNKGNFYERSRCADAGEWSNFSPLEETKPICWRNSQNKRQYEKISHS